MQDEPTMRAVAAVALGMLLAVGVPFRLRSRTGERLDRRREGWPVLVLLRPLGAVWLISLLLYLIDPDRMAWGQLPAVPSAIRWAGAPVLVASWLLFLWTLATLGPNLTDTVVTRREHRLVTQGPYAWVRHPFYVAAGLWLLGHSLLAANLWLAVLGAGILSVLGWRTRTEEQQLETRFGEDYRRYRAATGAVFPRLRSGSSNVSP